MTGKRETEKKVGDDVSKKKTRQNPPEWASGLRQLYDSVVEEPLPDTFDDLLSKLDKST